MAWEQTTSYEDCNQSTNSKKKMKGENMRVGGISPHVVDRLNKKSKVADRIEGGWIERVEGAGEGGWMQCVIRGRERLHWRTSSTQAEGMLGTVATLGSKQTQAVAPTAMWATDEREMRRWGREYTKERGKLNDFIADRGVFLFRFVWECVPVRVRTYVGSDDGENSSRLHVFVHVCVGVKKGDKLKEKLTWGVGPPCATRTSVLLLLLSPVMNTNPS